MNRRCAAWWWQGLGEGCGHPSPAGRSVFGQVPGAASSTEARWDRPPPRPTALPPRGWLGPRLQVLGNPARARRREIAFPPSTLALLLASLRLSSAPRRRLYRCQKFSIFPLKLKRVSIFLLARCSAQGRWDGRASLQCNSVQWGSATPAFPRKVKLGKIYYLARTARA